MAVFQLLVLAAASTAAPAPATDCKYDEAALVVLPFEAFDQDLSGGWRTLGYKRCNAEAADALRAYRLKHQPLTEGQRAILNWHEGQVRAEAGDYTRAIPLLMKGVNDQGEDQLFNRAFIEYALGTVAFLEHDKPALLSARARLAAIPKPTDWGDGTRTAVVNGKTVSFKSNWPANLNVLDGLIVCFDKSYAEAYSCRPAPLTPTPK